MFCSGIQVNQNLFFSVVKFENFFCCEKKMFIYSVYMTSNEG